jgi:hypothetical protein
VKRKDIDLIENSLERASDQVKSLIKKNISYHFSTWIKEGNMT